MKIVTLCAAICLTCFLSGCGKEPDPQGAESISYTLQINAIVGSATFSAPTLAELKDKSFATIKQRITEQLESDEPDASELDLEIWRQTIRSQKPTTLDKDGNSVRVGPENRMEKLRRVRFHFRKVDSGYQLISDGERIKLEDLEDSLDEKGFWLPKSTRKQKR